MDREQKLRFLKEILSSSKKLEDQGNPEISKLKKSIAKGAFSKAGIKDLDLDLSEEEFDEVAKESPWVVDSIFDVIESFSGDEEIDLGQGEPFKMESLHQGIHDMMNKFKEYEKNQGL